MKLYSHEYFIELDDYLATYSPLLKALMETKVNVDMKDGAIVIDDSIELEHLYAYTNILSGQYSYVP